MKSTFVLVFLLVCAAVPTASWAAATLPPDLTLSIPKGGDPVQTGDNITYEFLVDNIGESSSTGVTFTTRTPSEGSFVEFSPSTISCTGDFSPDSKVICDIGVVASNSPVTLTILWKAPDTETTLDWTGTLAGSGENIADEANNTASVSTDVVQPPPDNTGDTGTNNPGNNNGAAAADGGGCSLAKTETPGNAAVMLVFTVSLALMGLGRRRVRRRL